MPFESTQTGQHEEAKFKTNLSFPKWNYTFFNFCNRKVNNEMLNIHCHGNIFNTHLCLRKMTSELKSSCHEEEDLIWLSIFWATWTDDLGKTYTNHDLKHVSSSNMKRYIKFV